MRNIGIISLNYKELVQINKEKAEQPNKKLGQEYE